MIFLLITAGMAAGILVNGLADNLPYVSDVITSRHAMPRCGYCGATRTLTDLSYLVSFLFRGGNCARCGSPRPFRDILCEAFLVLAIPLFWIAGMRSPIDILSGSIILSVFLLIAVIDLEHRVVVSGTVLISVVVMMGLALLEGTSNGIGIALGGLFGFCTLLIFYLLGWLLGRVFRLGEGIEPLGFGDVWLGGMMGMAAGWYYAFSAAILAILLAGIYAIANILLHWIAKQPVRHLTFAYGPFLLLSGLMFYFFSGNFL